MANGKTRLINLMGKPLKVYRNIDDGSYILFPVQQKYGKSDVLREDAENAQIDEFVIKSSVMEIMVPPPERDTVFIVPDFVAATQARKDLIAPINVREDSQGKSYWCDGLEFYHVSTVQTQAIDDSPNVPDAGRVPVATEHKPTKDAPKQQPPRI